MKRVPALLLPSLVLLLSACAGSIEPQGYTLAAGSAPSENTAAPAASGYALSAEEKGLSCNRLTGRMKIRILQIRDYETRSRTSELSRSLHSAQGQVGGSGVGSNPDADYARDRAMLQAYNAELAAKGCKTLDIETEIKAGATPNR